MVEFHRFTLENGLKVIVHQDDTTPIVTFNLLYNVGSRDEDPERTGFAHLFEHLMFGGSVNIPVYDEPLERAGGENNAFTSTDITNYYITVPRDNLETAFWLESDRMLSLDFSQRSLDVQKSVVVEEFNQRYLNQPYGDAWLLLRPLAYKVHPYRWPTIGKDPKHIMDSNLQEVKDFFFSYYTPNNAILCLSGNVTIDEVKHLANKWFAPIPPREVKPKNLPKESAQIEQRVMEVTRSVPFHSIYTAFHMCHRLHPDYHVVDLISDILSNGKSSRLYQNLVKGKELFSSIDAYITGEIDEGLLVVAGILNKDVDPNDAQGAIFEELQDLPKSLNKQELEKVKNRLESTFTFGLTNSLDKAMNLCYFELLGDANMINTEVERYRKVTIGDVQRVSSQLFNVSNSSTLIYRAEKR
ncbi:MAG TPA: pitrilysin family protein [Tenuifilaceae bacterium]|nr:pitrilysin family protein [Tenuifilaceae bacterium]